MNCRELNFVLDTHEPEALTSAQRTAIDGHLATCETCRDEWANWRNIAALAIPATPASLRGRIASLLPAQAARRTAYAGRPRRAFVIGGLLLAGAALAMNLALRFAQDAPPAEATAVESLPEPVAAMPGGNSTAPAEEVAAEILESAAPNDASTAGDTPAVGGLDARSIVVVARPEPAAGPVELAEGAKCHQAVVERLQAVVGLNIIAGMRVSSFDDSGMDDWEIARELGAGNLLVVSTNNGCNAYLHDSRSSDSRATVAGAMYGGASFPPTDGWSGFATSVASSVREALLQDPATRIVEAQATLMNAALSDRQRIHALTDLYDRRGQPIPGAFDSAVVAVAVQIGMTSPDASARSTAWNFLKHVDDPYLVQPLLYALANDPDADVRQNAALTLNTFLDEPGVREALLRAAAEDPSQEPTVTCCLLTVREAAEWASVATEDLPDWVRGRLYDASLPARSRLLWFKFSPDGRFVFLRDLGDDAPAAVFEIGRNESDAGVRRMAWDALISSSRNPEFVPVLLDDLRNHPDEYVRSSAASALGQYLDLPEVRAAFEEAANDPSMAVRRSVGTQAGRDGP